MSKLRENTIQIRGQDFLVRELTGAEAAGVGKLLQTGPHRTDNWITSVACLNPKFKDEEEASLQPSVVCKKVAREALRLSGIDESEQKAAQEPEEKNG